MKVGLALLGEEALPGLEVRRQVGAVLQQPLGRRVDGWRKGTVGLVLC